MPPGSAPGWRGSPAHPSQPGAEPGPEDSREGRTQRARRGSRPRLRWPGQRRGRWRPRLARRHPWLGRQPDGTCPPAPPPRPARRSLLLAGLIGLGVGRSRALLGPPLAAANVAATRAGQGPRPAHDLKTWSPPSPLRGAWWACGPLSKPSLVLAPGAALVAASGRYLPRSQSCAPASLRFAPSAVRALLRSSLRAHGSPSRSRREAAWLAARAE